MQARIRKKKIIENCFILKHLVCYQILIPTKIATLLKTQIENLRKQNKYHKILNSEVIK